MKFIILQLVFILVLNSGSALEEVTTTLIPEIDVEGFKELEGKEDEIQAPGNLTSEELRRYNELDSWKSPEELEKLFPYYLTGYDNDDRPVWVAEFGKFRISPLFEHGPEKIAEFEKYVQKAGIRLYKSVAAENKNTTQLIGIVDFEGLPLSLLSQIPTLRLLAKLARQYRKVIEDHVGRVYVINVSFPAQTLINLIRPLLGRALKDVEIYGTNKNQWQHVLLANIPKSQLPLWYGGTPDHVPLEVYG